MISLRLRELKRSTRFHCTYKRRPEWQDENANERRPAPTGAVP